MDKEIKLSQILNIFVNIYRRHGDMIFGDDINYSSFYNSFEITKKKGLIVEVQLSPNLTFSLNEEKNIIHIIILHGLTLTFERIYKHEFKLILFQLTEMYNQLKD